MTRSSKAFGCFSETCMGRTYKQDNLEFSVETSTHFFRRGRVSHTMMFTGYSCKYYRFEWRTSPCNPSFKALALSKTCHEGMRKFHLAVLQLKKKKANIVNIGDQRMRTQFSAENLSEAQSLIYTCGNVCIPKPVWPDDLRYQTSMRFFVVCGGFFALEAWRVHFCLRRPGAFKTGNVFPL